MLHHWSLSVALRGGESRLKGGVKETRPCLLNWKCISRALMKPALLVSWGNHLNHAMQIIISTREQTLGAQIHIRMLFSYCGSFEVQGKNKTRACQVMSRRQVKQWKETFLKSLLWILHNPRFMLENTDAEGLCKVDLQRPAEAKLEKLIT